MKSFLFGSSLLLAMLFLSGKNCFSQQSVNAAGGYASGSGGTASFSIGVVNYTFISDTALKIGQGIQHAYEIFVYKGIEENNIALTYSIYPNPTSELLNLCLENNNYLNTNYTLSDINGKQIVSQKITGKETQISLCDLAPATYFVMVSDGVTCIKIFKIIKN